MVLYILIIVALISLVGYLSVKVYILHDIAVSEAKKSQHFRKELETTLDLVGEVLEHTLPILIDDCVRCEDYRFAQRYSDLLQRQKNLSKTK